MLLLYLAYYAECHTTFYLKQTSSFLRGLIARLTIYTQVLYYEI